MRYLLLLFCFFASLLCFSQKAGDVTFITKVDSANLTKDGIYMNGYVVNIDHYKAIRLHGKDIKVTGKVSVVKGVQNTPGQDMQQGRATDIKYIGSPKIEIIPGSGKQYNRVDAGRINRLVTRWEQYWNQHNMDSMGTLLHDDVDFVNVAGQWLKGKKQTIAVHKERHEVVFKNSLWTTDSIEIKYVKPDLAIVHIGWGLTGDVDPDGSTRQPRHGIFTWVVIKEKQEWLILSVHNVNIRETGAYMNPSSNK